MDVSASDPLSGPFNQYKIMRYIMILWLCRLYFSRYRRKPSKTVSGTVFYFDYKNKVTPMPDEFGIFAKFSCHWPFVTFRALFSTLWPHITFFSTFCWISSNFRIVILGFSNNREFACDLMNTVLASKVYYRGENLGKLRDFEFKAVNVDINLVNIDIISNTYLHLNL